jgi:beta-mannosidase
LKVLPQRIEPNVYPHRIRLHGPWDCEPLARTALLPDGRIEPTAGHVPVPCRMTIPCRWAEGGLGPFTGRVRFRRKFHWPGRLDYYERLWLVFWGVDYFAQVWVNGEVLGKHEGAFDPFEFDITRLIRPRNELVVEVDLPRDVEGRMFRGRLPADNGGLWGDVALEVRRESFLSGVRLWATFEASAPVLHVAGEVVGEVPQALELYVMLNGATVLYQVLPGDGPFEVLAPTPDVERWWPKVLAQFGNARLYEVRVELIQAASKLDTQAFLFGFREIEHESRSKSLRVNGKAVPAEGVKRLQLVSPLKLVRADEADRLGELLYVELPFEALPPAEGRRRLERERQAAAIVNHFQGHSAVLGHVWLDKDSRCC